jgi:rfaE bifunctional protein kinase chain/domain
MPAAQPVQTEPSLGVAQALQRMAGRRAVLVGDLMLDAYLYGQTQRVSREAPVLVVRQERVEYRLGGGANTAANLRALGLHTAVVGIVGRDAAGTRLQQMLVAQQADTSEVLALERATPVKTRILAGAFGTSRQQVLRLDSEPDTPVPDAVLEQLAEALQRQTATADVVVVSDYGAGTLGAPVVAVLHALVQRGVPVCVDSRYDLPRFVGMTAVTPNVPEAEDLVGFALGDRGAVARAGETLLQRLGCQAALVTQGQRGMTLFQPGVPAVHADVVGPAEVTDVTGAGDAVVATLGAAFAAGLDVVQGMRLANCAAGVVVTKMGTACALPHEIVAAAELGRVEL